MRISETRSLLERALPARQKVLLVSPPGVGKTQLKMEFCQRSGWQYLPICLPLVDPTYLRGYPYRENGTASHAPFDALAVALGASAPTLIDLDEMGGASETVIKAALRLVQFGDVGGKRLPECVVFSASSNDVGHGAGVAGLLEPMKDRWDTIISVEPHVDDTVGYGLSRGWDTSILAYLRNCPAALHDWKPRKDLQRSGATPRGWEMVSKWLSLAIDDPEVISGVVGRGRALEFLSFRALAKELPDIGEVLLRPDEAKVPENPSAMFLISMALASRMDGQTFGAAIRYLQRLPKPFRAAAVLDGFACEEQKIAEKREGQNYSRIHLSRGWTAWATSPDAKSIMSAALLRDL